MSSREIAELTGKRHDNVKRLIETMAERGTITFPQIEEISTATKPLTQYVFEGERGKRDSIIVVAQLSPEFTAALVDRWQQLEAQTATHPALPDFTDPAASAEAWAQQYRQRVAAERDVSALEHQVDDLQPKADALDHIASLEGSMCITDAAKNLAMKPKQLFEWLFLHEWIYKRVGNRDYLAYQTKLQAGLLVHKVHEYTGTDGELHYATRVCVTPLGLTRLATAIRADIAIASDVDTE
ncbi:phage antirepressor KilAC domain-containing protein [Paraburkholderia sprentiae]|nr:phage antirepressor KilAC domain-containing protein [Paraburkholderia sprentiae]